MRNIAKGPADCLGNAPASRASLRRRALIGGAAIGAGLALRPRLIGTAFAQATPIKIGVLAPLSGVYASLGTNMVNGIKMFWNSQGMRVAGRAITLVIEDEGTPQEGLRKARKLIEEDQADILLGVINSALGYALKDYVARAQKVWVATGAAADGIFVKSNNNPYAIRSSLSVWQATHPMGGWLADKGYKRVFVTGPDYAMGREAVASFSSTFQVNGAAKVGEIFAPLGTADYAPYLAAIKKASPDLVFASFAGNDAVRFVQQFAEFGLNTTVKLAGYGYLTSEDLLPAQGDAALGIYSGLNWSYGIDTPQNKAFITEYRTKYNATATVDAVAGYVGAQAIFEAIQSMKGIISSQEELSKALLAINFTSPRGPIRFDSSTNNVIQNIYISEVTRIDGGIHNRTLAKFDEVRDPGA